MRHGVRIEATTEADAICIGDALSECGTEVELEDVGVDRRTPGASGFEVVFGSLEGVSFDDNGIAIVKVTVDDHSYAMEGSS
jgi:hypothetical protein